MASIPACAMCAGVSKSGSPAPSPMTSLPSALRRAARAVTASVGDGLTRWTRRATDECTGSPDDRLSLAAGAILRDRALSDQRHCHKRSFVEHNPFELRADYAPA